MSMAKQRLHSTQHSSANNYFCEITCMLSSDGRTMVLFCTMHENSITFNVEDYCISVQTNCKSVNPSNTIIQYLRCTLLSCSEKETSGGQYYYSTGKMSFCNSFSESK